LITASLLDKEWEDSSEGSDVMKSLCKHINSSIDLRLACVPFDDQCEKHGTHSRHPRSDDQEYLPAAVRSVISFQPPACWCMALGFMKRPEKHEPQ
jgi:hypothetical protein